MRGLMRLLLTLGMCFGLLFMAGCTSFRPLYGKGPTGEGVSTSLAAVAVPEQRTRSAQLVRNELLNTMGTGPARYTLRLTVAESIGYVSALTVSNVRRQRFNINAHYDLVNIATGAVLASGDSFSNVSFDTVRQPVADLQASNNAMQRAATEVGQDLRQRVAAYFADHPV
jgi:LPS-assembly lipoprotein